MVLWIFHKTVPKTMKRKHDSDHVFRFRGRPEQALDIMTLEIPLLPYSFSAHSLQPTHTTSITMSQIRRWSASAAYIARRQGEVVCGHGWQEVGKGYGLLVQAERDEDRLVVTVYRKEGHRAVIRRVECAADAVLVLQGWFAVPDENGDFLVVRMLAAGFVAGFEGFCEVEGSEDG